MANLLIIDDEPSICWGLAQLGKRLGHGVRTAGSAEKGLQLAAEAPAEVVMLDVRLPGMDGLDALARLRAQTPGLPVIIMTAHGDLQTAVEAIRRGAFEYLVKPFTLEQAERLIERALALPPPGAPQATSGPAVDDSLIGRTPAMQEVFRRIALVAPAHACVYVAGESGSGKELVARAVHRYSPRAKGPFAAVNVAALNPSLVESELFGHVRGAFTGADQPRGGLLVEASGGTLFLDEVAEIPLPVQVKLLRALELGEVTPVGSSRPVKCDFRLVTATHRDLAARVRSGEFRHDLYYRLSTFRIDLPPLRERRGDIPLLIEHFLAHLGGRSGAVSQPAMAEAERRDWHGNVRELRNAVEHALVLARDSAILPEHWPPPIPPLTSELSAAENHSPADALPVLVRRWAEARLAAEPPPETLYDDLIRVIEKPLFEAALERVKGQCLGAARLLGIHRTTLRKKLDEHGVRSDE